MKWVRIGLLLFGAVGVVALLLWGYLSIDGRFRIGMTDTISLCGSTTPERIQVFNHFGDHETGDVHEVAQSDIEFFCEVHFTLRVVPQSFTVEQLSDSPEIVLASSRKGEQSVVRLVSLKDEDGWAVLTKSASYRNKWGNISHCYAPKATAIPQEGIPR